MRLPRLMYLIFTIFFAIQYVIGFVMYPTICGVLKRTVSRDAVPELTTAASACLMIDCVSPKRIFT